MPSRLTATLTMLVRGLAVAGCALGASAGESFIVGPRALGMGGANVASVDDGTAQYYNPAAFGFFGRKPAEGSRADNNDLARRSWGFGVDASAGARLHGDFGRYASTLNDANATLNSLSANGIQNQTDLNNLVSVANAVANLSTGLQSFSVDANAGGTVRIGSFGIGARMYGQVSGVAAIDTVNVGIGAGLGGSTTLNQAVLATPGLNPGDGQTVLLGGLTGQGSFTAASIQALDFAARQAGITAHEASALTSLLISADSAFNDPSRLIDNNQTRAIVTGIGIAEIPVTWGHAFSDQLSIGGSLKVLVGRVYADEVLLIDNDIGEQIQAVRDHYKESLNVGIDLGVMYRLPMLNLGLTGRNLNAPSFKGPTVNGRRFGDITLDPQVTLGAAFMPTSTLVLEVDCDLLAADTTLAHYQSQNLSLGVEWNVFRTLALRVGAYRNLAQGDIGPVITAGVGVNLWAVRVDLAGGFSLDKQEYDGKDYPSEARAALRIATEW